MTNIECCLCLYYYSHQPACKKVARMRKKDGMTRSSQSFQRSLHPKMPLLGRWRLLLAVAFMPSVFISRQQCCNVIQAFPSSSSVLSHLLLTWRVFLQSRTTTTTRIHSSCCHCHPTQRECCFSIITKSPLRLFSISPQQPLQQQHLDYYFDDNSNNNNNNNNNNKVLPSKENNNNHDNDDHDTIFALSSGSSGQATAVAVVASRVHGHPTFYNASSPHPMIIMIRIIITNPPFLCPAVHALQLVCSFN